MKKYALMLAAVAVSLTTVAAEAGGWGGNKGKSSSLINVSPSVDLGNITVGNGVLNGNDILSGNVVSGILNGNKTGILSGIGVGVGNILSGNKSYSLKKH